MQPELTRVKTAARLYREAEARTSDSRINRDLHIVKAFKAGATQTAIAEAAGMSQPSVRDVLVKVGLA